MECGTTTTYVESSKPHNTSTALKCTALKNARMEFGLQSAWLVEASVQTTALNHLVCTLLIKCKTKLYTHNKCDFFFAINYKMLKEEGFCKWFIYSAWVNFPPFFFPLKQKLSENITCSHSESRIGYDMLWVECSNKSSNVLDFCRWWWWRA